MTDDSLSSHAHELDLRPRPRRSPPRPTAPPTCTTPQRPTTRGSGRSRPAPASRGPRTSSAPWTGTNAPVREVVRRRPAQRRLQLRRPPRRGRQRRPGRDPLRGRGRRHPHHHLRRPPARGLARPPTRSPSSASAPATRVAIYMPMIPEAVFTMLACARLGAPALGGLRRLLRRRPALPHRRRRRPRWSSPRDGSSAAASPPRSSPPSTRPCRTRARWTRCSWCAAPAPSVEWHEGRDVWWHDVVDRRPTPTRRQPHDSRAPALHPLHLRHHREAQGHPPHHRRLPHPGRLHQRRRLRPAPRDRRLLVHGRRRLGHRALLHRLRPRSPTAPPR